MTSRTKNIIIGIVAIILLLSLCYFSWRCGRDSVLKNTGVDTTVTNRKDSATTQPKPKKIIPPDTVTITITKWLKPEVPKPTTIEPTTDWTAVYLSPTDSLSELKRLWAIEKDYNSRVIYEDSAMTKDSSVKVKVRDTLFRNRATNRSWLFEKRDSIIKSVTVLRPPQKFVLSWGVSALGNPNPKNIFHMGGVDLSLKMPNNIQYGLGTFVDKDGKVYFGVQYRRPIRLRK